MSRKDYIKFAELFSAVLNGCDICDDADCSIVWTTLRIGAADIFERDNPNFDRDKFYEACEKSCGD